MQAVAPCAASRGNRLLALTPSPPLASTPLPCVLPGCGNAAARWSVSGSLSRTDLLKTLLPAGLEKEEAVCSACSLGRAPFTALSVWRRKRERLTDRESARESERERE